MGGETEDQNHQGNRDPVKRIVDKFPIDDLIKHSSGLFGFIILPRLRGERENGKTDKRHQDDANPVAKIPAKI